MKWPSQARRKANGSDAKLLIVCVSRWEGGRHALTAELPVYFPNILCHHDWGLLRWSCSHRRLSSSQGVRRLRATPRMHVIFGLGAADCQTLLNLAERRQPQHAAYSVGSIMGQVLILQNWFQRYTNCTIVGFWQKMKGR